MTDREKLEIIKDFVCDYYESSFSSDAEEVAYLNGTLSCIQKVIAFKGCGANSEEE